MRWSQSCRFRGCPKGFVVVGRGRWTQCAEVQKQSLQREDCCWDRKRNEKNIWNPQGILKVLTLFSGFCWKLQKRMALFFASIFLLRKLESRSFDLNHGEDIWKLPLSFFWRNMCELRAACVYRVYFLHLFLFHTQDNDMLSDIPHISVPVSWTLSETVKLCFLNLRDVQLHLTLITS